MDGVGVDGGGLLLHGRPVDDSVGSAPAPQAGEGSHEATSADSGRQFRGTTGEVHQGHNDGSRGAIGQRGRFPKLVSAHGEDEDVYRRQCSRVGHRHPHAARGKGRPRALEPNSRPELGQSFPASDESHVDSCLVQQAGVNLPYNAGTDDPHPGHRMVWARNAPRPRCDMWAARERS
ncbi:hypothetical protein GCM10012283_28140 [Phycicoccus endophyticus]|nr:hypothetical protein GCM10012283_28140 [Phycicoccus endophyticus]